MGVDLGPLGGPFQRLQGLPASRQIRCNGVGATWPVAEDRRGGPKGGLLAPLRPLRVYSSTTNIMVGMGSDLNLTCKAVLFDMYGCACAPKPLVGDSDFRVEDACRGERLSCGFAAPEGNCACRRDP
jgi:hypothetical protein